MGACANGDAVKDALHSARSILLIALAEPVAVVDDIEEESWPTCCAGYSTFRSDCTPLISRSTVKVAASSTVIVPGLRTPLLSALVSYPFELGVDPDLTHAGNPRPHLRC